MQAEAFEDVADWGAGFCEDEAAGGVFDGAGGGEEHGEGGGGDHFDFGEVDQHVNAGAAGEFLELVLNLLEAFHGEAALELEHGHIGELGVFQRCHGRLVNGWRTRMSAPPVWYISGR